MSAPGCCRHCGDDCTAGMPNPYLYGHQSESEAAAWDDEACPACDEAKRIAAAIEAEEARLYRQCSCSDEYVSGDCRVGMLAAAKIARGQT